MMTIVDNDVKSVRNKDDDTMMMTNVGNGVKSVRTTTQ